MDAFLLGFVLGLLLGLAGVGLLLWLLVRVANREAVVKLLEASLALGKGEEPDAEEQANS